MIHVEGGKIVWNDTVIAQILPGGDEKCAMIATAADSWISALGKESGFKIPNMSNATLPFLADMIGTIKRRAKILKAMEGFFKEALKGRTAAGIVTSGDHYDVKVSEMARTGVKKDLLAAKYPEVAVDPDVLSTTEYLQVNCKKKSEDTWPSEDWSDMED